MKTFSRQTMIATTAILALSAFAASAAPATAGDTAANQPVSATSQPAAASNNDDMTGKIEQRITDLHAALKITTAEQPQWDQFTLIMRDNARDMDQAFEHRVTVLPAMNAAENMQSYAAISMLHAEGMQKMTPAIGALYAMMSDDQKKIADKEFIAKAHHGVEQPKS
jgi:protein CpxP